jgi:hypothetical protein
MFHRVASGEIAQSPRKLEWMEDLSGVVADPSTSIRRLPLRCLLKGIDDLLAPIPQLLW